MFNTIENVRNEQKRIDDDENDVDNGLGGPSSHSGRGMQRSLVPPFIYNMGAINGA